MRSVQSLAGARSRTGRAAVDALLRSLGAGAASAQAVATAMTGSPGHVDAREAETVWREGEAAPHRAPRQNESLPGTVVHQEGEGDEAQALVGLGQIAGHR